MVLTTVLDHAERKRKPFFLHFHTPTKSDNVEDHINIDFNDLVLNAGGEEVTYDSFETIINQNPSIKNLVDDYNKTGVTVNGRKRKPSSGTKPKQSDSKKIVSKMARRAVNLGKKKF